MFRNLMSLVLVLVVSLVWVLPAQADVRVSNKAVDAGLWGATGLLVLQASDWAVPKLAVRATVKASKESAKVTVVVSSAIGKFAFKFGRPLVRILR